MGGLAISSRRARLSFSATGTALIDALVNAGLLVNVWNSLKLLLSGYAIGISIAAVLVILAVGSRIVTDLDLSLSPALHYESDNFTGGG